MPPLDTSNMNLAIQNLPDGSSNYMATTLVTGSCPDVSQGTSEKPRDEMQVGPLRKRKRSIPEEISEDSPKRLYESNGTQRYEQKMGEGLFS